MNLRQFQQTLLDNGFIYTKGNPENDVEEFHIMNAHLTVFDNFLHLISLVSII